MIPIQDDYGTNAPLSEQPLPATQAFGLATDAALQDNPFTKLIVGEAYSSLGNKSRPHGGQLTHIPTYNREQINARAQQMGVSLDTTADSMTSAQLELLLEHARSKRSTQEQLGAVESGPMKTALSLGGALWGGLQDPLNLAASFVPVVGEERWAEAGAQASAVARTLSRVKYGIAEGVVGQAALEPVNYAYSKQIGDDYTLRDSLMNLATGGVMGGLIHGVKGGITDAIEFQRSRMANVAPQEHLAITQEALNQMMTDRPVHVDSMVDMAQARQDLNMREPIPAVGEPALKSGEKISIEAQHEKLELPPSSDGPTGDRITYSAKNAAGDEIGSAVFNKYSDGKAIPEDIRVNPEYQRQGVMSEIYRKAQRDGLDIAESEHLSPAGRAFTEAQRTTSAARAVDPDQAVASRIADIKDTTTVHDASMDEWKAAAEQVKQGVVPPGGELAAITAKAADEQAAMKQQAALHDVPLPEHELAAHDEAVQKIQTQQKVAEAIATCRLGRT